MYQKYEKGVGRILKGISFKSLGVACLSLGFWACNSEGSNPVAPDPTPTTEVPGSQNPEVGIAGIDPVLVGTWYLHFNSGNPASTADEGVIVFNEASQFAWKSGECVFNGSAVSQSNALTLTVNEGCPGGIEPGMVLQYSWAIGDGYLFVLPAGQPEEKSFAFALAPIEVGSQAGVSTTEMNVPTLEGDEASSSSVTPSSGLNPSLNGSSSSQIVAPMSSVSVPSVDPNLQVWNACVAQGKCGTMTDKRDGKTYRWAQYRNQKWMVDNLNYGEFLLVDENNPATSYVIQNDDSKVEKTCYNNDPAMCAKYGALYNFDEVFQATTIGWGTPATQNFYDVDGNAIFFNPYFPAAGICPDGWHLPFVQNFAYFEPNNNLVGVKVAIEGHDGVGNSMNSALRVDDSWESPNNASNLSNFNILPSGYATVSGNNTVGYYTRFKAGEDASENKYDQVSYYWAGNPASGANTGTWWVYGFEKNRTTGEVKMYVEGLDRSPVDNVLYSVRCVQDHWNYQLGEPFDASFHNPYESYYE